MGRIPSFFVRILGAIAITWIAVHLSAPLRAHVRYLESADVQPADPACVRDAVWALQHSNFHADILSAGTVCRRDATVAVHEGWGEYVGLSNVVVAADVKATAATIVIMGHSLSRANANYEQIFTQYMSQGADIDSVVFVWANQKEPIPLYVKWLASKRRETGTPHLLVLRARRNSLNYRYLVGDFVRTDAVFTVDDDVLPSPRLVRCMLEVWARAPDQVLGLDLRRVGMVEKTTGSEKRAMYEHVRHEHVQPSRVAGDARLRNTVIGQTMLFHRRYMAMYARDDAVLALVERRKNCDDIIINAFAANATGFGATLVRRSKGFLRAKLSDAHGLSNTVGFAPGMDGTENAWFALRAEFVEWAYEHFGPSAFGHVETVGKFPTFHTCENTGK